MREIGDKHKAEIEAVLAELATIAESIPEKDFDADKKLLDLEPYLHLADSMSNTVLGSRDEFMGVNKLVSDPTHFNLYTFYPSYMLSNRIAAEPAESTFEAEVKAFIDLRYAIVYYPVGYRDAAITDKAFVAEPLKLILAMYDRKNDQWIFRKTFTVDPPEQIEFTYGAGQKETNAEFAVKNFYYETVLPQIEKYLVEQIGGTIEFDKEAYRRDGTRFELYNVQ
jgi:hypothetical protein